MKIKPLAEARHGSKGEQDSELARALESYLTNLEAGRRPDPQKLIDQHPAVADRLRACLASLQFVNQAALEVSGDGRQPALNAGEAPGGGVLGDFRIVREVGRGGMGVVYEAQQVSLGRRVALKILPFAAVVDPRQVARFKNEAQAAAQLDHPNIVDVIAIGCERGVHYFAMRYIDGLTLAQVIEQLREQVTGNREQVASGGRQPPVGFAASRPAARVPRRQPPVDVASPPGIGSKGSGFGGEGSQEEQSAERGVRSREEFRSQEPGVRSKKADPPQLRVPRSALRAWMTRLRPLRRSPTSDFRPPISPAPPIQNLIRRSADKIQNPRRSPACPPTAARTAASSSVRRPGSWFRSPRRWTMRTKWASSIAT